ncbi:MULTISPECIES: hypothetical protein [unclassified Shewanella]|jgi:hypothetical protein|uniref:hypothetical protein n=1 Tax=unclassified Shewanella TaxID=196818 RepID=UPI0021D8C7BF|nr:MULTISPECIES: hypothetical protein [unclassified Shewanella]MCU8023903.1 hypothetical protein [Shewanella sp. SM78]MCU8080972.1 hypothetical protein [Shewanella sp. SM103]
MDIFLFITCSLFAKNHQKSSSMLMFREHPRVYLHQAAVDFRQLINGLAIIVEQQLSLSTTDGC